MEAPFFYKEEVSPYSTHVKTEKSFETSEKTNYGTKEAICYHLQESSFNSSSTFHSETPLEFTTVTGQHSADEDPEEDQLGEELLYSSDYFATGNSSQLPSEISSRQISDEKRYRAHETILLNHKLNTITCSDLNFSSYQTKFETGEMTNIEASSSEDQEEEDNEDIFTELPVSGTVLENLYRLNICQTKQDRYGYICNKDISPILSGSNLNEKLKDGNMQVQTRSVKEYEWSDSMVCLVEKLEQLNLDIEEALSAGSSPSSTPCTKRRKELYTDKVKTGLHRDHRRKGVAPSKWAALHDSPGLPSPQSSTELETKMLSQKLDREKAGHHQRRASKVGKTGGFVDFLKLN